MQAERINVVTDESEQEFGGVMLELELLEDAGQLMGTLGYNTDLFKEATVVRIAQQFKVLSLLQHLPDSCMRILCDTCCGALTFLLPPR